MGTVTGDRLRALRQELGLSQEEVAKKIGVSRPAYVNYEQGKSRPVRKLQELANLFDVTTDYILGESKPPMIHPELYYKDKKVIEIAKKLQDDPKRKILFDATQDLTVEDIEYVINLVDSIKKARGIK